MVTSTPSMVQSYKQVLEELASAQACAASSMSELAELRRQNKQLQAQVGHSKLYSAVDAVARACCSVCSLDTCSVPPLACLNKP